MIRGIFVSGRDLQYFGEGGAILLAYLRQQSVDDLNYRAMEFESRKTDADPNDEDDLARFQEFQQMNTGWFTFSENRIEKDLGMSKERQRKYLKVLEDAGEIKTKRRGLPARRWIYIPSGKER